MKQKIYRLDGNERRTKMAKRLPKQETTVLSSYSDKDRKWYVVDAEDKVLGRLSTQISKILMGKNKPTFTPNVDSGDFVVVINADKIKLTGDKLNQKIYHKYSGYPGGMYDTQAKVMLEKHPEKVIYYAVKRMLPKSGLGISMLKKLKVYAGPEHPHQAQKPEKIEL